MRIIVFVIVLALLLEARAAYDRVNQTDTVEIPDGRIQVAAVMTGDRKSSPHCYATAAEVFERYPGMHALWTMMMQGHIGERCWHVGAPMMLCNDGSVPKPAPRSTPTPVAVPKRMPLPPPTNQQQLFEQFQQWYRTQQLRQQGF